MQPLLPLILLSTFLPLGRLPAQPCDAPAQLTAARRFYAEGDFAAAQSAALFGLACSHHRDSFKLQRLLYTSLRNQQERREALNVARESARHFLPGASPEDSLLLLLDLAEAHIARRDSRAWQYLQWVDRIRNAGSPNDFPGRRKYVAGLAQIRLAERPDSGLILYREALPFLDPTPGENSYLRGRIYRALGNHARTAGDLAQSRRYYEQELALYEAHYPPGHPDLAITHYNLGSVLYEMLAYQPALDHYLKSYAVWDTAFDHDSRYYRFLTEAIGDMYWELGNRPRALEFYDRSVAGELPESRDSSQTLALTADTLLAEGQYADALRYYEQALDFRLRNFGTEHPLTAACQNFIGRAHQAAGRSEAAIGAYQASLQMLVPGFSSDAVAQNPGPEAEVRSLHYLLEALAGKGELLLARAERTGEAADLSAAAATLQRAVGYLEQFRQRPLSEASKLFWNERSLPLLANAVRAEWLLYQHDQQVTHLHTAFATAEKSRAFLLMAALQENQATAFAGVPPELTAREGNLRRQLLDYENKILAEERRCEQARTKQLELWREKLRTLRQDYDLLMSQIQREHPRYFAWKYQVETASVLDLQAQLGREGMTLLSFFAGEEELFLFQLAEDGLQAYAYPKDSLYLHWTRELTDLLAQSGNWLDQPEETYRRYAHAAYGLYQRLLAKPLAETEAERLLIIPSPELARIPFAALLTQPAETNGRAYAELAYLLRDYATAYAPSATFWWQAIQEPSTPLRQPEYAGFAPDFQASRTSLGERLAPLPYAREEVDAGARLFSGPRYLGAAATETAFRAETADILHLATHAWLDERNPLLSRLILHRADSTEDGLLHAYELYGMEVPAQLALLSACRTAAGPFWESEGAMSLERAFQYAGCASLLSSYWATDDAASATLVGYFLEHIRAGLPKDVALRHAQLRYLQEGDPAHSAPFYWAGFRLAGNTQALVFFERSPWYWRLGVGLGLLALFWLAAAVRNPLAP